MLKIINANGRTLELNQNTVIAVDRFNSLFSSDDDFAHDITYPGQAGLTDSNKIFIEYGHLVEAKNSVYEFPVQVHVSGYQFYSAIFSYKIVKDQIEYILKVNFGAVVSRMKTTKLQDIYSLDSVYIGSTQAPMAAYMKETCINPLNYNCVFFPLYNEKWDSTADGVKWLNEWDHGNQKFIPPATLSGSSKWNMAPFFRLSYIIKKVIEYLNFNAAGSYFDDPDCQDIYIYTRKTLRNYGIGACFNYMPQIFINDFFKILTQRLKISFDFDSLNNTVTVGMPSTVLNSTDCLDISQYIISVDEKSVADQKGYYITLKIDETDEAMNRGTGDEQDFTAPYALVVGDGANKVEMDIGTLNQVDTESYSYPESKQYFNNSNDEQVTDWPIRLLTFKGMKPISSGVVFPEAKAYNLSGTDAQWYMFLNDSKKIIINSSIPPGFVSKMSPGMKLACKSERNTFFYALPEKSSYQMTNSKTERMGVKIEARTIVSEFSTQYYIKEIDPEALESGNANEYKAYWDPLIYGFAEIKVLRVPTGGSTTVYGYTPINSSTDDGGMGGTIGTNFFISGPRESSQQRLYSPVKPQYYIAFGKKGYFTAVADYYTFDTINDGVRDNKPIWIVF